MRETVCVDVQMYMPVCACKCASLGVQQQLAVRLKSGCAPEHVRDAGVLPHPSHTCTHLGMGYMPFAFSASNFRESLMPFCWMA